MKAIEEHAKQQKALVKNDYNSENAYDSKNSNFFWKKGNTLLNGIIKSILWAKKIIIYKIII